MNTAQAQGPTPCSPPPHSPPMSPRVPERAGAILHPSTSMPDHPATSLLSEHDFDQAFTQTPTRQTSRSSRRRKHFYDPCCASSGIHVNGNSNYRAMERLLTLPALPTTPSMGNRTRSLSAGYGIRTPQKVNIRVRHRPERTEYDENENGGNANLNATANGHGGGTSMHPTQPFHSYSHYNAVGHPTSHDYRMITTSSGPGAGTLPAKYNRRRAFSSGPLIGSTILVGMSSRDRDPLDCGGSSDGASTISSMEGSERTSSRPRSRSPLPTASTGTNTNAIAMNGGENGAGTGTSTLQNGNIHGNGVSLSTGMKIVHLGDVNVSYRSRNAGTGTATNGTCIETGTNTAAPADTGTGASSTKPTVSTYTPLDRSPTFLQLPCMFLGSNSRRRIVSPSATSDLHVNAQDVEKNNNNRPCLAENFTDPRSFVRRRVLQAISCIFVGMVLLSALNAITSPELPQGVKEDLGSIRTVKNFQGEWGLTLSDTSEEETNDHRREGNVRKKRKPRLAQANSLATQHLERPNALVSSTAEMNGHGKKTQQFVLTDDEIKKKTTSLEDKSYRHSHSYSSHSGNHSPILIWLVLVSLLSAIIHRVYREMARQCRQVKAQLRRSRDYSMPSSSASHWNHCHSG